MPKFGFMLDAPYKYPAWDAFDADVAELARLGYHGIELGLGDPARLDTERLVKSLSRHGQALAGIATGASYFEEGLCLTSPDISVRVRAVDRLKAHIDLAARLGGVIVIGQMQGFKSDEPDRNSANARTVECLKQAAEYAAARGVALMLEPVNRFEVGHNHTAVEVLELVEIIHSPALTIMLDTFHINIEESSLDGPVYLVGERLGHMHVFENHRGLFGTGHMDLGRILRATLEVNYQGYWIFGDFSPNPLPIRAAAAMDFMRRAIGVSSR
jgi:sugar phosphate isomerase/epimerase